MRPRRRVASNEFGVWGIRQAGSFTAALIVLLGNRIEETFPHKGGDSTSQQAPS